MDLNDLLKQSSEKRASDVHLKVGVPPVLRIDGHLVALQEAGKLSREWLVETLYGIMTPHQKEQFAREHDLDMVRADGSNPSRSRRPLPRRPSPCHPTYRHRGR